MPFVYARFLGLLGFSRVLLANIISIFRPMMLEVSESDVRVVVHKSCALAAQTFMIAMANEGYDTLPLEGLDSRRLKRLLKLPHGAEINMVISCGIRNGNKGIWANGAEFRLKRSIITFNLDDQLNRQCSNTMIPFAYYHFTTLLHVFMNPADKRLGYTVSGRNM